MDGDGMTPRKKKWLLGTLAISLVILIVGGIYVGPYLREMSAASYIRSRGGRIEMASGRISTVVWDGRELTKRDIEETAKLQHLQNLGLSKTNIQDDDLGKMADLSITEYLVLDNTSITGSSFHKLSAAKNLKKLVLNGSAFDDRNMSALAAAFPNLEVLILRDTSISDASLKELIRCPLTFVRLENTAIGDQGVRYLAEIPTLTFVGLANTKVSDACLAELAKLLNLKTVTLVGNQLSAEAIEEFKKLRPKIKLDWEPTEK